tara:strand:- start:270 stop:758 length:489 start_codon:yes stop_codon:yes gene_type:complete
MIIECINCSKKFEVNSDLIPIEGRTIQCGSCNHVWFFKKSDQNQLKIKQNDIQEKSYVKKEKFENEELKFKSQKTKKTSKKDISDLDEKKGSELIRYKPKSNFTFIKFLSYIFVIIVSFVGLILILDTFKAYLYNFFPNLEFILYSLYETLKDIELFIKDLF